MTALPSVRRIHHPRSSNCWWITAHAASATLDLLERAYTTVQCAHVASCLGVTTEEAAAQGIGAGWTLGDDGMFAVVRRKVEDVGTLGVDAVAKLAEYMTHVTDFDGSDEDED